jgi:hypothetical protein
MAEVAKIEKFAACELAALRTELRKARMDSWQAAELVSNFLAGRGYGVNSKAMRSALPRLAVIRGSQEEIQSLLETVAYIM